MRRSIIGLLLIVSAVFVASGCSVLEVVADDRNQLAVTYATQKVLERDDVTEERVLELVAKAKTYVTEGNSVTVAALVDEARERLAESSLSEADQMLVEIILSRAQERIESKLGGGILADEQRVQLLTVLNWIEAAATSKP